MWQGRPQLRTVAQRRAFLQDPSHKHVVYFTPKHGSWLNQVEIWFGVLARRVLRDLRRHRIGWVAQRPTHSLFAHLTAVEQVEQSAGTFLHISISREKRNEIFLNRH